MTQPLTPPTNASRAAFAKRTLEYFADLCGEVGPGDQLLEQNLVDLLANIMHLLDDSEIDFDYCVESAREHHDEEYKGD